MRTSNALLMALCALLIGAAGCGSSSGGGGGAKPAAKKKGEEASEVKAKPAAATHPEIVYQYNPVAKRDPFRSPLGEMAVSELSMGNRTMCTDPLCQWDLDQLTLVAVVTGDSNPIAMVEDPSGRGHIVRRSARIGKQDGRVSQILRDGMIITEYWIGPDGKTKPNHVSLKLKQDVALAPPVDMLTGQPYQ